MEKVSVIVPIYKAQAYIEKCIQAICEQTYSNLEIILVDDGSPDRCGLICDDFARMDHRICVIHKENGGAASARNAGLDRMSGSYVAFIDADDVIVEDYIEKLYRLREESGAQVSICGFQSVDEKGKTVSIDHLHDLLDESYENGSAGLRDFPQNGEEVILKGLQGYWEYVAPWGKLFEASLYEGIRYPDWAAYEDESVYIRVFDRVEKVAEMPERLYTYVQHAGSLMNSDFSIPKMEARIAMWEERLRAFSDGSRKHESLLNPMKQAYIAWGILYLMQNEEKMPREAVKRILLGITNMRMALYKGPHLYNEKETRKLRIKYILLKLCPWILKRKYS